MSFTSTLNITDKQILDACRVIKLVGEKTKERSDKSLLEEDYTVNVEIEYTFDGKRKNTPVKIVLKKSLFNTEDGDSALLIVSNTAEKVKDLLKEDPVSGVSKGGDDRQAAFHVRPLRAEERSAEELRAHSRR